MPSQHTPSAPLTWQDENQRYLVARLANLRAHLQRHIAKARADKNGHAEVVDEPIPVMSVSAPPPALLALQTRLGLSDFEAEVLLLCAGTELDSRFAALYAAAQGDANRAYPTFSLGLAALPAAHWSALMPNAPLRKCELIEFATTADINSAPLTTRPLRVTEQVLHYLVGASHSLEDRLNDLAERVEPKASWDDLVLPPDQMTVLHTITMHVRQRDKVYGEWGFAEKSARGLGISALFAGASGTGKTLAAEVLANALGLDVYRIDLSSVVSKYIGETEKNLKRVFDAAEGTGAILLFDEADALFGKRSEVKDSHDRYANIEVGYLLQRMESYRGLAILTTNLKHSLDNAFKRRIRFEVDFPFPDFAHRAEIWRRVFPTQTPLNGLDFECLAQLNVAGGNIRNIAMNAAFLAADGEQRVTMAHLMEAARTEYAKLDKPLTETEVEGWPLVAAVTFNGSGTIPENANHSPPRRRKTA